MLSPFFMHCTVAFHLYNSNISSYIRKVLSYGSQKHTLVVKIGMKDIMNILYMKKTS